MSGADRKRQARRTDPRVGAHGIVSAVLLVVLLAATGWPRDDERLAAVAQVAACDVASHGGFGERCALARELAARPLGCWYARHALCAPRVPSRARRVDSGGLPPPRAPTS